MMQLLHVQAKQHVSNQNKGLKTAQEKCDAVLLHMLPTPTVL